MSDILRMARGICSRLNPMVGTRATGGTISLRTTSGTYALAANAPLYASPVIGGSIRPDIVFKTSGAYSLTTTPQTVQVRAVYGGADTNIHAGTVLRWLPPVSGLPATATLTQALSGGAAPTDGSLEDAKQLLFLEQLTQQASAELFAGKATRFPTLVLAWDGSSHDGKGDGTLAGRAGRGVSIIEESWTLFVVTSRQDAEDMRRMQGLLLMQRARRLLNNWRTTEDGEILSAPAPLTVTRCRRVAVGPQVYVYALEVLAEHSEDRSIVDTRAYPDWETSREQLQTTPTDEHPDDPLTVVDQTQDMTTP